MPIARSEAISGICKTHRVGNPGMVLMVPTKGNKKPAPMEALTSLMGMRNPLGAPLIVGSAESERCVLAMQIGRSLNP